MIVGMAETVLELRGVTKAYGKTPALTGVDLSVARGELFGLLGPNGAGKTTLMSIISGLIEPSDGEVSLFGSPFRANNPDQKRLIGLACQDLALYPELTARENLYFFGRLYGLAGDDLDQRADELLAAVNLTDRADHRAGTFSGGMKRRLNLALAVIHRPQLLLLDEPTTGVDPQSRNHIFEHVKALNRDGLTVVYTSHYMEEVAALCSRIAILDFGTIKACDTLPNLLNHLTGVARVELPTIPDGLAERCQTLPGVERVEIDGQQLVLFGSNLTMALPGLFANCVGMGVAPAGLQLEPPTLERVFLHLTGRELRD